MPHAYYRRTHAGLMATLVVGAVACDRAVLAPEARPKPELASPEIARPFQASGRTGLVAVARAADPASGRLGAYRVVTEAQGRAGERAGFRSCVTEIDHVHCYARNYRRGGQ